VKLFHGSSYAALSYLVRNARESPFTDSTQRFEILEAANLIHKDLSHYLRRNTVAEKLFFDFELAPEDVDMTAYCVMVNKETYQVVAYSNDAAILTAVKLHFDDGRTLHDDTEIDIVSSYGQLDAICRAKPRNERGEV